MKRKKIVIKNQGIVIEVPYADKYLFSIEGITTQEFIDKFLYRFEEFINSKLSIMVVNNITIKNIFCFKRRKNE